VKVTLLEGAGKVKISIYDHRGEKVNSQMIEVTEDIIYPIDMSQMPEGKYTLRLTSKRIGKVEQSVEVKRKKN